MGNMKGPQFDAVVQSLFEAKLAPVKAGLEQTKKTLEENTKAMHMFKGFSKQYTLAFLMMIFVLAAVCTYCNDKFKVM